MRILALDTTTRDGSAALVEDERIVDVRGGDGSRSHAERLPSELIALLARHGATLRDVDVFAVASGPGMFTGLRIGIATIQGLAFTLGRRVVAVPALDALAHAAAGALTPGRLIQAWMDAHRRDVFAAAYRVGDGAPFAPERVTPIGPPRVGPPLEMLDHAAASEAPITFIGDGAVLYRDDILSRLPNAEVASLPPIAGTIGRIAAERAKRGDVIDPAAIQPLYVRRPDAEVAREARDSAPR